MVLDPSSYPSKDTLKNARDQLVSQDIDILITNQRPVLIPTIAGLYQQFQYRLYLSSQKLMSLMGVCTPKDFRGNIFRFDAFSLYLKDNVNGSPTRSYFARNVVVNAQGFKTYLGLFLNYVNAGKRSYFRANRLHKFKRFERFVAIATGRITVLATPIYTAFLIYLAVNFKQPALFGLSLAIFAGILVLLINSDTSLGLPEKLKKTLLIPLAYSLFHIAAIFQLVAVALSPLLPHNKDH